MPGYQVETTFFYTADSQSPVDTEPVKNSLATARWVWAAQNDAHIAQRPSTEWPLHRSSQCRCRLHNSAYHTLSHRSTNHQYHNCSPARPHPGKLLSE